MVEGVALLAVDVVSLGCALYLLKVCTEEAPWVRTRCWFRGFYEGCSRCCGDSVRAAGGGGGKVVIL